MAIRLRRESEDTKMALAVEPALSFRLVTPDEYLDREEKAETRSEYIAGEIIAMAGGTPNHSRLCVAVLAGLLLHLEAAGSSCEVFESNIKVRRENVGPFFYPDATVVCGEPVFDGDSCLHNPHLIVEVLSESTEEYDRGEKFRNYRQFESLQHYVLIAQDRVYVEHYARLEGILWERVGEYGARSESLALPSLGIAVPLAEIYRRIPQS